MLKRIMLLMCLFALFAVPAYAADITVQGESYTRYSDSTDMAIKIMPEGSGNPVLVISNWKNPKYDEYTIEYDITAPQKGGYEFQVLTTELDSMYTSNFYFSINGGDYIYSGDVFEKISQPGTSFASEVMYLYSLGTVELIQGTNTVKFIINESKETASNWPEFYLDYFTLTKNTEFKLDSVTPTKPVSVFTDDDIVGFKLGYSMYPTSSKNYTAIIEDYYHNRIKSTSFTLGTSELKKSLDFGKLSAGWYRLIISDGSSNVYNSGFSVTHKETASKENNNFAIDFASFALAKYKTDIQKYGYALKSAGINTVRERYYWTNYQTGENTFRRNEQEYQNKTLSDIGLDVVNMFHDAPSSMLTDGGFMPTDLLKVYNFQKDYAEHMAGLVDVMEVWNEADTSFAAETADQYAAFLKAAAIGIHDGNSNMKKIIGGFADHSFNTKYMDICMLNDVMEYSDVYNFHAYAQNGNNYDKAPTLSRDEITSNRDIVKAYGYDNRRVWVTEGGIGLNGVVERSRQQQARASVINNIQSMANGSDKHFLFVVPPYTENGIEYGVFTSDKTPTPAYTSLENLVYRLGGANYKGKFRDLPSNKVQGYLFDNKGNDVGVFWAESGTSYVQVPSNTNITVSDMMGKERTVSPRNGVVGLSVGMDPVFVVFNGAVDDSYCLPKNDKDYTLFSKTVKGEGITTTILAEKDTNLVNITMDLGSAGAKTIVSGKVTKANGDIVFITQGYTDNSGKYTFSYINNDPGGVYNINLAAPAKSIFQTIEGIDIRTANQVYYQDAEIDYSKRIVLQQKFDDTSYQDEKNKGYLINKTNGSMCTLTVYNFSDTEQSGIINASVSDGFSLDIPAQEVTVAPWGTAEIYFFVMVDSNVTTAKNGFLQFTGTMNGEAITKSTSLIRCRKQDSITPAGYFSKASGYRNWTTGKRASKGGTVTVEATGRTREVKVNVDLPGHGWAYPYFEVTSTEKNSIKTSSGIKITVGAESNIPQALLNVQILMTDGRTFFPGDSYAKPIKAAYTEYYFPWSDMILTRGEGEDFDFDDIMAISVGVNTKGTNQLSFFLKDIGWYIDPDNNDQTEWDSVIISGIENDAVLFKDYTNTITAQLPSSEEIKDVKVYLSGKSYPYTQNGNNISIDISSLDLGTYSLLVTAENNQGYMYRDSRDFIIQ